ncbi:MAG: hypothetical protein ABI778_04965 [Ignavibacteriota bacterium]
MNRRGYGITALIIGTITLVVVPVVLRAQSAQVDSAPAQEVRTYTAPPSAFQTQKPKRTSEELTIPSAPRNESRPFASVEPRVEIFKMQAGNQDHIPAGFYATISPKSYDTVFIYEGATDEFKVIGVQPGKEVIQAPDSLAVANEVTVRMTRFNGEDIPVIQEKKITSQAMVIRSGFIPAQGFGSKRYRFAVKPGAFMLTGSSMITASVHLLGKDNIGTILCTITNIDQKRGIFYLETANEVPKGESINWIVVNTP